jgi:hypothetical protein
MPFALFFLLAAIILFLLAGFGVASGRWNLVALGLACLALAMLLDTGGIMPA